MEGSRLRDAGAHGDLHLEPAAANLAFRSGGTWSLLKIGSFIEQETGLVPTDDDLNDPRFTTVAGIASLLAERTAGAGAPRSGTPQ